MNYTLKHIEGEYYLLSKEEIKPEMANVWDTKETKFHPFLKQLGNTNIVFEKIKNNEFLKVIASTKAIEGIALLDTENIEIKLCINGFEFEGRVKNSWEAEIETYSNPDATNILGGSPSGVDYEVLDELRDLYESKAPKITNNYITIKSLK